MDNQELENWPTFGQRFQQQIKNADSGYKVKKNDGGYIIYYWYSSENEQTFPSTWGKLQKWTLWSDPLETFLIFW